jgi:glycosyltransferase involved in cell wall biosynthesis
MERALARRTDALVVVTPFDRLQGLAMGIGRPDQYRLIRSGIDLETPRLGRFRRHEIRAELGIDGRFAIGTVGRLAEQKDLGTLIDGFARAELETAVLVLIGEGPERRALEVRAREAGVDGRVLFSGGRHDAAELVAGLDVFALTSRWEGLPRSLVEAIAAGVPVVATPVGGVTELVRPEETGTLVAPCDPAELATALRDQLERPFHFRRLAACASAEIGPFSVDSMREELASLWFDLAQR